MCWNLLLHLEQCSEICLKSSDSIFPWHLIMICNHWIVAGHGVLCVYAGLVPTKRWVQIHVGPLSSSTVQSSLWFCQLSAVEMQETWSAVGQMSSFSSQLAETLLWCIYRCTGHMLSKLDCRRSPRALVDIYLQCEYAVVIYYWHFCLSLWLDTDCF